MLAWLLNRQIKLKCQGIAPETEAKAKVVEAGRSSLSSLVASAYRANEPPFARVFSPSDVIRVLVDSPGLEIENRDRTSQAVAKACREMGCVPILDNAVRTVDGRRKYLWARTAQDAGKLRSEAPATLAKLYRDGRKSDDADERERGQHEAAEEFAE